MGIDKILKILISVFAILVQSVAAYASSDCRNFVFVKPLPHETAETNVADWNAFVLTLGDDHQEVISNPANNKPILSYLETHKDKSNFNRSLLAVAKYYGCFLLPQDRISALDELEISSEYGEPIAIIYLSAQPEYLTDKEAKRRWVTKLKRATKTPLVESARLNLQIMELREDIKDKSPKGFVSPFRYEKVYKKQKKPIQKLCKTATSAFKIWRQNGIALSALSACNVHPFGNDNDYEAYKFLAASLSVGYIPADNELDRLAWKLGNTGAARDSFRQGFSYSGVNLMQSDLDYLERHIARLVEKSNQINAYRKTQSSPQTVNSGARTRKAKGFLSHETESGFSKICYYDVLGDKKALNKSSSELCPISHDF